MGKRYYWLKLPEGFFRQKPIKKLRKIAGGDTYTIIYLKMLLIAMKNDGKLYFEGVEDDFYEELALDLDEDSENVKVTVLFLIRQGLMELVDETEYRLTECDKMVGSESASAERVRKHREQKALQCNSNVTGVKRIGNVEKEIEKEIEQEFRKMYAWLDSNPKNRKTERGIKRFITGWLGRAQDKAPIIKAGGMQDNRRMTTGQYMESTANWYGGGN